MSAPPDLAPLQVQPPEDAVEFAAAVRQLLAEHAGREALRAAWESPGGRIPGLWSRLAGIGATGLVVPERYGGAGCDLTAAYPTLVEAGRAALPEPLTATVVAAVLLGRTGGPAAEQWLPAIADGSAAVGVGVGAGRLVLGGRHADVVLLARPGEPAYLAEPEQVGLHSVNSVDRGCGVAEVTQAAGTLTALEDLDPRDAFDVAVAAVAAELLGVAQAMLDMAVAHARTRRQFGQPIGAFQAVKHLLADVYVELSFAQPVVARGVWATVNEAGGQTHLRASHAMFAAGRAARRAARAALQVHGAIGYTYEHDLHIWLKRVWTLTSLLGDPAYHRDRAAEVVLGEEKETQ